MSSDIFESIRKQWQFAMSQQVQMRQIRFDSDFWPSLHENVQMRRASNMAVDVDFYEALAATFAELSSYELKMLRIDFAKYPFSNDVQWRIARVGQYARIHWNLQGAPHDAPMQIIAGGEIVVKEIVWNN
jgi:hypothetical protein